MNRGGFKGCAGAVGCIAVIIGVVLIYSVFQVVYPLTMGLLFPWEAPRAEKAPHDAVIRVLAPEGEMYRVQWSFFGTTNGRIDPQTGYRDYPVDTDAVDNGQIDVSVYAGGEDSHPAGNTEIPLGAVLFVDGEIADCDGGSGSAKVYWQGETEELGGISNRIVCNSHKWSSLD